MSSRSYPKRTAKNVVDSDGTAIFTSGKMTSDSLLTQKKTAQYDKPVIHLNMNKVAVGKADDLLKDFIEKNVIEILNLAESRGSKDPEIYTKTSQVQEKSIMKVEIDLSP